MHSLERYLKRNAERYKDKIAFKFNGAMLTYGSLYDRAVRESEKYVDRKRKATVIRGSSSAEFFVNYFAIHIADSVAVIVSDNETEGKILELDKKLDGVQFRDDIADVLFTTGTTGTPKGVMYSKETIVSIAENLVEGLWFHPNLDFIITGPLNHLGCLSKVYAIVMSGASCLILKGIKNFGDFFNAIKSSDHKIATFLVPSNIKIVTSFCSRLLAECAEKIEFIETGADTLDKSTMVKFSKLIPNARLYNTYASTETGVVSTFDYSRDQQECCLGKALKNTDFEITSDGRIRCSGKTIMSGYIHLGNNIICDYLPEKSFTTSDYGMIDENGRLHFLCREGDIINTGGYKVHPQEVERIANSLDSISECICVPVPHPVLNKALKLIYKVERYSTIDNNVIIKELSKELEPHKVPLYYEETRSIAHTFNGKIDRNAYKTTQA